MSGERQRRWLALALAGMALAGGCARGGSDAGDEPAKVALEPQFAPETTVGEGDAGGAPTTVAGAGAAGVPTATPTSAAGGGGAATTVPASGGGAAPTTVAGAAPVTSTTAAIEDREFDTTPSLLDKPPAWADLSAARLTRTAEGFELRVRLRGGAPANSGSDDHTMNIASFYDVDGNGSIDYEVWLNVASGGWGASYFDNTGGGKGGFQEKSGVAVAPEGAEVVARFPLSHLAGAQRLRWSLASEWGRYASLGTTAAARDDLPDNDAPATFPT